MMKWIAVLLLSFLSFSTFAANHDLACGQALPASDPHFCASFKSVAVCHCTESGIPAGKCQNMNNIYQLMINLYKTVENACAHQHDTSVQICIDDWKCYRNGGRDSQGRLCSSTGNACSA